MNYTAAVSGGWIVLCLAYYFCPRYGGVCWFEGPRANVERMEAESENGTIDEKASVRT